MTQQSIVFSETQSPYEFELIFPKERIKFKAHASTLEKKVLLIINQIGELPVRLEPDEIVTKTEISKRLDCSVPFVRREIIHRNNFPLPLTGLRGKTVRWRWWDVAHWLEDHRVEGFNPPPREVTDAIARLNAAFSVFKILGRNLCLKR